MLVVVACGGMRRPADEPRSQTDTTGVVVETGPASPGDPMGNIPESSPKVTSGSVASPMEGECPRGEPHSDATDLASCVTSCQGQDQAVPLGSTCISQWQSCALQCRVKFEHAR
jgi:hypothetical protein